MLTAAEALPSARRLWDGAWDTRVAGAALRSPGGAAGLGMDVQVGPLPWYKVRGYRCATRGWGHWGSVSVFTFRLCVSVDIISARIAGFHLSCTTPSEFFIVRTK